MSKHVTHAILYCFIIISVDTCVCELSQFFNMPQIPVGHPPHIPINKPSFNWEGANLHDSLMFFNEQCNFVLVSGPFKSASDTDKVSTFLNWLGPKLYSILKHLVFPDGKSKTVYLDVIHQFTLYFKPTQSIIQSWYQLGNLTSASCKSQTEFDIASKCTFSIKFLFMIPNSNTRVKDELIKSMKPESMLHDLIPIAKSGESTIITEKQVPVDSVNKGGCSTSKGSG